ncbi:MAG: hypothetical protein H6735_00195 [Alphaproteobacteria bacterium]|nr:hypothetical protein [Alphaproteobacteria bacterium]
MLAHSNAYVTLRRNAQDTINFAVLTCHAVPALNAYMKAVEARAAPKLPDSDHFTVVQSHDKLRAFKSAYKKTLGRFVLLSSFSHFEAYVKDVGQEVCAFHGDWAGSIRARNYESLASNSPEVERARKRLMERRKAGYEQRYAGLQRDLLLRNFRFPSDLIASFGISALMTRLGELRASGIPDLLRDAFMFDLTEDERKEFDRLRDLRNDVAHGNVQEVDLSVAMDGNAFLRDLAKRIDQHMVRHFMVLEPEGPA